MRRLAAIDIGSQTIRLLVADITADRRLLPVFKDRSIIRLGEGLEESGALQAESITRAVNCISAFKTKAVAFGCEAIYAGATACVRTASNKNDFLQKLYTATAITAHVLTGEEEARTSLAGVQSVLHTVYPSMVVLDIGGGSTELIWINGDSITEAVSMPLGVIGLTERFFSQDLPGDSEAMRARIRTILLEYGISGSVFKGVDVLVGTAGTVTTLAAMDLGMTQYTADRINGYCLTLAAIHTLYQLMLSLPVAARSGVPGLEPGRAAVMPAGTAILIEVMKLIGKTRVLVSDAGLLEGILLQHL